jgi:hypothetical protein
MLTEEEAQALAKELKNRDELEWGEAWGRGFSLKILQIKALENYLGRHIEAGAGSRENFPYWAMVWESALALADFLWGQEPVPVERFWKWGLAWVLWDFLPRRFLVRYQEKTLRPAEGSKKTSFLSCAPGSSNPPIRSQEKELVRGHPETMLIYGRPS